MKDLAAWLQRVNSATNAAEVFQIVDEFRPGNWSDEQRSQMSKTYITALSKLEVTTSLDQPENAAKSKKKVASSIDSQKETQQEPMGPESDEMIDEEVWYEKL